MCYKKAMPIYEYACAKCGKTIEIIQKMSDKPLKTHAGCGGKLTKLISASGFQFKGTGWYVTDYARKSTGEGSESKDSESKDAKPETNKTAEASGNSAKEQSTTSSTSDKSEKSEKPAKPSSSGKSKKS
jgi:putative FmdB family regulatory protein